MKTKLLLTLTAACLFLMPSAIFGQAPNLGSTSGFALFTRSGALNNNGASVITGNIGSYDSSPVGFTGPGTVNGTIYPVGDTHLNQPFTDLGAAFGSFGANGSVLGSPLETYNTTGFIYTGTYHTVGAADLNGNFTLDAQGNPNAIFIINVNGALKTSAGSNILLTGSASASNVYWLVNGFVELGAGTVFKGTIIASGQIELMEGTTFSGRLLSTSGAILLHNNVVAIPSSVYTDISSIETVNTDVEITIAPNPFGSYTTILLKNDSKLNECDLKVYSTLGEEVLNTTFTKQGATIDMSKLQSGIYFYKVINDNKTIQSGKLISKQ